MRCCPWAWITENRYTRTKLQWYYSNQTLPSPRCWAFALNHYWSIIGRIYECMGYTTLKINHIGDWGTQFGALIGAYDHWNDDAMFNQDPIQALKDLCKVSPRKKQTPSLEDAARAVFVIGKSTPKNTNSGKVSTVGH